ncbi:MAG: hypothetical protein SynsKO_30180 [Synoicihabitans sp.]
MHVVGGGNENGVDAMVECFEQLSVVAESLGAGGLRALLRQNFRIYITETDDINLREVQQLPQVLTAAAAHANLGYLKAVVGGAGSKAAR